MRVLIAGNLANVGYEMADAMRKKGIDVKLLLPEYPAQPEDPKNIHPDLEKKGYPEWLVRFDNHSRGLGWNNWKWQIIREMRKKDYDLIIAMTEFSIFAMFSGKPYAAMSTGSDMRQLFFEKSLKGSLYRLSYKKARVIIWGEPDKISLLSKLRIEKKSIFATTPRNVNIFPQDIDKGNLRNKFIIFCPTAQDWRCKQNDKFLYAYNKLCSVREDVYLIISDRGPDIENAKQILSTGNAKNKFRLVPFMDAEKLQYYYNLSDVVVDQFFVGSIGMITVEAMKCGKPVLIKLDEKSFKKCYEHIPNGIINVDTTDGIFEELNKLASDEQLRKSLGQQNLEWIEKNWNYDTLTDRYISICKKVMYR